MLQSPALLLFFRLDTRLQLLDIYDEESSVVEKVLLGIHRRACSAKIIKSQILDIAKPVLKYICVVVKGSL